MPPVALARLRATMATDLKLQLRNGFYLAIGFLVVMYVVVINLLPGFSWQPWLAPLLLTNLLVATYFFMAGQVLLEKTEGTLEAQIVTPLGVREYLGSKIVTLTALSLVENVAIAVLALGWDIAALPLIAGLVLAAAIYCLGGFIAVARFDSINEFIFPSVPWVAASSLPVLHYLDVWTPLLMYLHPLQPAMVLLGGAVEPLAPWQWLYGVLG